MPGKKRARKCSRARQFVQGLCGLWEEPVYRVFSTPPAVMADVASANCFIRIGGDQQEGKACDVIFRRLLKGLVRITENRFPLAGDTR